MHLARKTEELFLQTQRRSFFVTAFEIAFRVVVRDSGEFNPFLMHTQVDAVIAHMSASAAQRGTDYRSAVRAIEQVRSTSHDFRLKVGIISDLRTSHNATDHIQGLPK